MSVQVLPYVPGFGEKLAETLSQAGKDIGKGLNKRFVQKNDQRILDRLYSDDPNLEQLTPLQKIMMQSKLSTDAQKRVADIDRTSFRNEDLKHRHAKENRLNEQHLTGAYDNRIKELTNEIKESSDKDERNGLSQRRERLKKERSVNITRLRGNIPPKFEFLDEQDAADFINAMNAPKEEEAPKLEAQSPKSSKQKKKLTPQVVQHFIKQAKGNKDLAKKLAFEQGFE